TGCQRYQKIKVRLIDSAFLFSLDWSFGGNPTWVLSVKYKKISDFLYKKRCFFVFCKDLF
ncbi:MAG: hypothetical protein Q8O84_03415, partial [Nanoarchaeota archaeon]|nr:hypothetical protein [Nanoarchaeota archaeon]